MRVQPGTFLAGLTPPKDLWGFGKKKGFEKNMKGLQHVKKTSGQEESLGWAMGKKKVALPPFVPIKTGEGVKKEGEKMSGGGENEDIKN